MSKNPEIKTMTMVRRIRDQENKLLKGKSPEEQIAIYRASAQRMRERAEAIIREKRQRSSIVTR